MQDTYDKYLNKLNTSVKQLYNTKPTNCETD